MGNKRATRSTGKAKVSSSRDEVPDIYQDMLAEVLSSQPLLPERPLKKRRTGPRPPLRNDENVYRQAEKVESEDDENAEFEDVLGNHESEDHSMSSGKATQTVYRSSEEDEDSDCSDREWDAFNFNPEDQSTEAESMGDLELTLSTRPTPQKLNTAPRRRAVTKAEKELRLEIHKIHVLCLLSHVERRNSWCNDPEVQKTLKPLLDKKMFQFLRPKASLSQFGQAESLKRGLDMVASMWNKKFRVTARGIRRALWAADEKDLENYTLPDDADPSYEKADFRAAAKTLEGSRDLGTQLYCALLRSAELDVRLVCSLQPLPFTAGGPSMPRPKRKRVSSPRSSVKDDHCDTIDFNTFNFAEPRNSGLQVSPRRRLGHPNAADYNMPSMAPPPRPPSTATRKIIRESPFPVYWIEVFDVAHQKWFPVDPLVTNTISKSQKLEPPSTDRENAMSYVIAFEEDRCARDVTRRYVKAYNSKTRKSRVECTNGGAKWWRKTMRAYKRGYVSDVDQFEDIELAAAEAREPMPKNIVDFKDHPYFALERHLKRNEVLTTTREVGRVAAGRDVTSPGGKKMESVFRRKDVKIARSADAWYRLGRDVKMMEQPIKILPPKDRRGEDGFDDALDDRAGTNIYSEDQTEVYEAPPIVNGRVPKNSFGNIDVFVPSMVPKGGVHLLHDDSARAARLLGIDYSDALTGFEFRGRHGTAVIKGAVVAAEYSDAIEAVIQGFRDEETMEEERRRAVTALKAWRHFLMALRIKRRIDGYEVEGEDNSMNEQMSEDDGANLVPDDTAESNNEGCGFTRRENDDNSEGGGKSPIENAAHKTRESSLPKDEGSIVEDDQIEDNVDEGMESEEYYDDGEGGFIRE